MAPAAGPALVRVPGARRRYEIRGVGTLQLEGWASRRATAEAAVGSWELSRGLWRRRAQATAAGSVVGTFSRGSLFRRGGSLTWETRPLELRSTSVWRQRYALREDGQDLVVLTASGRGKRPVTIAFGRSAAIEPALLLFAAFLVLGFAQDANAGAGAAAGGAAGAL